MREMIDLTGKKFGRLTVVGLDHRKKRKNGGHDIYWLCNCDCGNSAVVLGSSLRYGDTRSCGCLNRETFLNNRMESATGNLNGHYKHGDHRTRLYKIWTGMRRRCNNKNDRYYKYYGGKGIKVCDEWDEFLSFKSWAIENGYHESEPGVRLGEHLSIDRIDPSGDYCPANCRWITLSENVSHARNGKPIKRKGA